MKVKERRPEETIKGVVVYKVPCTKCNHVYIGETGRSLSCRLKEYRQAVKTGNMNNGIAAHAWINEHHVDWEAAKVMAHEEHLWKRLKSFGSYHHQANKGHLQPGLWTKT